jgi:hypothetical protein
VDANPGDNTLSPDGSTLFVTHYDEIRWRRMSADSNLVLVDTATMTVRQRRALCPAAHGVRLSGDGRTLFATCASDELAVVDLADPALPVRRVPLPGGAPGTTGCQRCPYAVAVAPDGSAWVSSLGPNNGSAGGAAWTCSCPGREATPQPALSSPIASCCCPAGQSSRRSRRCRTFRAATWPTSPSRPARAIACTCCVLDGPGAPSVQLQPLTLEPGQCLNAHMLLIAADGGSAQLICEGDHKGPGTLLWLDLPGRRVLGMAATGVFPDGLTLVPGTGAALP